MIPDIQQVCRVAGQIKSSIFHGQTKRLTELADRDQWASIELLLQWAHWHFFFARKHPALAISFAGDAWKTLIPRLNPAVRRAGPTQFTRLGQPIELKPNEIAPFAAIDGVKTIGDLGVHTRQLFERLWKQGHVMLSRA